MYIEYGLKNGAGGGLYEKKWGIHTHGLLEVLTVPMAPPML
jgi:hypothetical protein